VFSHNGSVTGWPASMAELASTVPVTDLLTMDAATDSALLWVLLRARLNDGVDPGKALSELVTAVAAAATGSRLNLMLTDGRSVWATAWGHALNTQVTSEGLTVASESCDDLPGWEPVPEGYLVHGCAAGGIETRPIDGLDRPWVGAR
jgi:glutamine amidotransferase